MSEASGLRAVSRMRAWWRLSAIRRALLRDDAKIEEYNAAVERYNAEVDER